MGWVQARDQVASIIEATTGLSTAGGVVDKFKHVVEGGAEVAAGTRSFWFDFSRGGMRGHVTIAPPRWFQYPVDLVIVYEDRTDITLLLELIALDHAALAARLPDQTLWDSANSTIESLFVEDGDEIMTFDIEPIEGAFLVKHHMFFEFRP